MKSIKYKSGYKYQLTENYYVNIPMKLPKGFTKQAIDLLSIARIDRDEAFLFLCKGYAWDGCSGPAIDTKKNMRAGLVHDALYQLIRNAMIGLDQKESADLIFRRILKEDGMGIMRKIFYQAVKRCGSFATNPKNKKQIKTAP